MSSIERQVYICFDEPDGLIIQTDIGTYNRYYKLLGWELMGRAQPFANMRAKTYKTHELKPDTLGSQHRLL